MTNDNEGRARAWIERALEAGGVLYREGGKPYLAGKGEIILDACAYALAAAVRAKGEMDAQGIRGMADVSNGLVHAGHRHALTWLRAHAADVPEVPR
jgi:hypothetical protein